MSVDLLVWNYASIVIIRSKMYLYMKQNKYIQIIFMNNIGAIKANHTILWQNHIWKSFISLYSNKPLNSAIWLDIRRSVVLSKLCQICNDKDIENKHMFTLVSIFSFLSVLFICTHHNCIFIHFVQMIAFILLELARFRGINIIHGA